MLILLFWVSSRCNAIPSDQFHFPHDLVHQTQPQFSDSVFSVTCCIETKNSFGPVPFLVLLCSVAVFLNFIREGFSAHVSSFLLFWVSSVWGALIVGPCFFFSRVNNSSTRTAASRSFSVGHGTRTNFRVPPRRGRRSRRSTLFLGEFQDGCIDKLRFHFSKSFLTPRIWERESIKISR